nr:hypothetical protein [Variovorax boronicumulans]
MIRLQVMPQDTNSALVRFYADPNSPPLADYLMVCLISWTNENPTEVWIHGLAKTDAGRASLISSRPLFLAFRDKMRELGFETMRATRAEGRVLPRARPHPDGNGLVIAIADLYREPPDSKFALLD